MTSWQFLFGCSIVVMTSKFYKKEIQDSNHLQVRKNTPQWKLSTKKIAFIQLVLTQFGTWALMSLLS